MTWRLQAQSLMMKTWRHGVYRFDSDFDSVISIVTARADPIIVPELYSQLVGYEQRQELHGRDYSTTNVASRDHGSPFVHSGFIRGHG
jgi:hypothetical protein